MTFRNIVSIVSKHSFWMFATYGIDVNESMLLWINLTSLANPQHPQSIGEIEDRRRSENVAVLQAPPVFVEETVCDVWSQCLSQIRLMTHSSSAATLTLLKQTMVNYSKSVCQLAPLFCMNHKNEFTLGWCQLCLVHIALSDHFPLRNPGMSFKML